MDFSRVQNLAHHCYQIHADPSPKSPLPSSFFSSPQPPTRDDLASNNITHSHPKPSAPAPRPRVSGSSVISLLLHLSLSPLFPIISLPRCWFQTIFPLFFLNPLLWELSYCWNKFECCNINLSPLFPIISLSSLMLSNGPYLKLFFLFSFLNLYCDN